MRSSRGPRAGRTARGSALTPEEPSILAGEGARAMLRIQLERLIETCATLDMVQFNFPHGTLPMNRTAALRIATLALVAAGAVLAVLSWRERAERLNQAAPDAAIQTLPADDSAIGNAFHPGHEPTPSAPGAVPPGAMPPGGNFYAQPGIWRDQHGAELTLASLKGRPSVLTFIYTSCEDACPLIVKSMQAGLERVPAALRARAQLLLISIDPEKDSPAALLDYAGKMGLKGDQWRLLTAPDAVVRPLAGMAGFHYTRVGRHFSHNAVIAVTTAEGELAGWFADDRITQADPLGQGLARALEP